MNRAIILSVIFAVAAGTNFLPRPRLDGRVVGGFQVDVRHVPHQVSLQSTSHFCGGSLLSHNFVLTAAHCTDGTPASSLKVRVGSSQHASGGEFFKVKAVHQHPKFNFNTINYDFSLLELEKPVEFNGERFPVRLPEQDEEVKDGALLLASGWGNTQSSQESRDNLRAAVVPKYNDEACNKAYAQYGGITNTMLCAGFDQGGKDACQGDSGGPLTHNGVLVGVVSWGYGCAVSWLPWSLFPCCFSTRLGEECHWFLIDYRSQVKAKNKN
uniref:trypsin n=1 Tax=Phlebotomus papatasi TaxID=29031 RepID=Q7Z0G0_PHLPP|nr:trypsin 4 [Phlebotomus papatasi]